VPVHCVNEGCSKHDATQAPTLLRRALPQHRLVCSFSPVQCQYCNAMVPKQLIPVHQQTGQAKGKRKRGGHSSSGSSSTDVAGEDPRVPLCGAIPVPCENGCGASIRRDGLAEHTRSECPEQFVACPIEGCKAQVKRSALAGHMNDGMHMLLLVQELGRQKQEIVGLRRLLAQPFERCALGMVCAPVKVEGYTLGAWRKKPNTDHLGNPSAGVSEIVGTTCTLDEACRHQVHRSIAQYKACYLTYVCPLPCLSV
jgi:hypothetical protein